MKHEPGTFRSFGVSIVDAEKTPDAQTAGALYFLTGSSGAGKTTLLKRVTAAKSDPRWSARHIDDHGVPSAHEIDAAGGGWAWQRVQIQKWIDCAIRQNAVFVIDGQARPSDVLAIARASGLRDVRVVLVDCGHDERRRRLSEERRDPDVDNPDIYRWAAYLAGQAHALNLEIIDTTDAALGPASDLLAASIERFVHAVGRQ